MVNFRKKLEANTSSKSSNNHDLKVINMQSKNNYGSVIFVPINPSDGSDSVAVLNDVLEVAENYSFKDKDGKESKGKRFLKLLNREDYDGMEQNEIDQYKEIRSMAKKLKAHKFSKSKNDDRKTRDGIIRTKTYTLLVGWVIEHRSKTGSIINEKCPALLVFSSKGFEVEFEKAMKAKDKKSGSSEWMVKLFNDSLHRKMYISIDYKLSDDPKKIGYIVNLSIEKFDDETTRYTDGNESELDLTPYKDKVAKIINPVKAWLGMNADASSNWNQRTVNSIEVQMHRYLNKYCGESYELPEKEEVEKVATHDPLEYVKPDSQDKLPPEDKDSKDEWD